jgi:hypothetical protein
LARVSAIVALGARQPAAAAANTKPQAAQERFKRSRPTDTSDQTVPAFNSSRKPRAVERSSGSCADRRAFRAAFGVADGLQCAEALSYRRRRSKDRDTAALARIPSTGLDKIAMGFVLFLMALTASVPGANIPAICQSARDGASPERKVAAYEACIQADQAARAQPQRRWGQFSTSA